MNGVRDVNRIKMAALVTALVLPLVATVAAPGAAFAATPQCTTGNVKNGAWLPAASNGSFTCIMGEGAQSDAVYWLQSSLDQCYTDITLDWDSKYGPQTRKAVLKIQDKYNLDEDGVYGPKTRAKMLWKPAITSEPCKTVG